MIRVTKPARVKHRARKWFRRSHRRIPQEFKAVAHGAYQDLRELYWLYENHLKTLKPQTAIEIGVATGGTTRLFLDVVGPNGTVVGLDINDELIAEDVLDDPRFELVLGDSRSDEVYDRVKELAWGADLLLIDGLHTPEGVQKDTNRYVPLVRDGGLVLWHDVRLESPQGIKQHWYQVLKPAHFGSTEYYHVPFNTGFGIWYKTDDTVDDSLASAEEALATGDFERAAEHAERIVQHDSRCAHGQYLLGRALVAQGQLDAARMRLTLAVACDPKNPTYTGALLGLAQQSGDESLALVLSLQAAEAAPAPMLAEIARNLEALGFLERAQACQERLSERNPAALLDKARLLQRREMTQAEIGDTLLALLGRVGTEAEHGRVRAEALGLAADTADTMLKLQHYVEAGTFVDRVIALAPEFPARAWI